MVIRSCAALAFLTIANGLRQWPLPAAPTAKTQLSADSKVYNEMPWDGGDRVEVESVSPSLQKVSKGQGNPIGVDPETLAHALAPGAASSEQAAATAAALFQSRSRDFRAGTGMVQDEVFILLGPEEAGTNLMQHLVLSNFDGLESSHRPQGEIWKHSNSGAEDIYTELSKNMKRQPLNETSVVMIIRSPLSQIVSWTDAKNRPNDMEGCVARPYTDMNRSCSANLAACMPGLQLHGLAHSPVLFNSTVDAYNRYVKQYQQIATDKRFKGARLFTYEDVVYNTEEVINDLAKLFGKPLPDVMNLQDHSSKGAVGVGLAQAKEKIEQRLYLRGLSNPAKEAMCQGLDYNLADTLLEGSYFPTGDPRRRPHSYDCRLVSGFKLH